MIFWMLSILLWETSSFFRIKRFSNPLIDSNWLCDNPSYYNPINYSWGSEWSRLWFNCKIRSCLRSIKFISWMRLFDANSASRDEHWGAIVSIRLCYILRNRSQGRELRGLMLFIRLWDRLSWIIFLQEWMPSNELRRLNCNWTYYRFVKN